MFSALPSRPIESKSSEPGFATELRDLHLQKVTSLNSPSAALLQHRTPLSLLLSGFVREAGH